METFKQLAKQTRLLLVMVLVVLTVLPIASQAIIKAYWTNAPLSPTIISLLVSLLIAGVMAIVLHHLLTQPLKVITQGLSHLDPAKHAVAAPETHSLLMGRELVTSVMAQVYGLATSGQPTRTISGQSASVPLSISFVANNLPLPLLVLDPSETIVFANAQAAAYLGVSESDLIGKNLYMMLDMSFPSEHTLDAWLKDVKLKNATATKTWERVSLKVLDNHPSRLFDLAAYYNKDNPAKLETMLVLFDHTKQYSQDEQAISFIALSVHELRTPLTLLRGYIEAFEEELAGQLSPQMTDFMLKMSASAQQLTAFVNNILNVARIDDDQLELKLHEENWSTIIASAVANLSLRAKVRGLTLHSQVAADLPTVAVDRLSIHEVLNNLVDNAIKYSGQAKVITIDARLNNEGLVETTVTDQGLGISSSIMPNLFTKFYRDHRNRAQIGGTGLGLYLCKAIVSAHGGNIWVRSQEGQGSTFGFTLLPYAKLAEELKNSDNDEIIRDAHGWIKNHSLYRR